MTTGFDPTIVDGALKDLCILSNIHDPTALMLHYANDFFQRLEDAGYGKFGTENPKKTVEFLCRFLVPE